MSKTKKYLAQWVVVDKPGSNFHKKAGVVMDEEFFYNGKICCRVIFSNCVESFEYENLKVIQL